jgi:hypothetical protein
LCSSPESARHDLDPVTIGIEDERDVLHGALRELLLERHAEALEPSARLLDVAHSDCNVAEAAARVGVARGVAGEGRVALGAMIVRELEDACVAR